MTTTGKHTQGPWKVRGGIDECFIDAPGIVCLAVVNKCINAPERKRELAANARLIAAGPELLAACQRWIKEGTEFAAVNHFDLSKEGTAFAQALAAIRKAEGKA